MNSFVAIDFETASEDRATVCALGWAVVSNDAVSDVGWTPLDPQIRPGDWSVFNTSIHGLTANDVLGAPSFVDFWCTLRDVIGDGPVLAHYAAFDVSVLRAELQRYEIVSRA